ncbi:MAG: glutathione peroxidase [Paludibacteraceae bacterium]
MKTNFYDYKASTIQGNDVSMAEYKDKVVLVVNTASKCGFTPQFEGLETLYKKYKEKGFAILGFPTNQFAKQDPGSNEEILQFCQLNYNVTFPMFEKIEVNGKNTEPLFKYLKKAQPGSLGKRIKWNFTKFLIGKDGKPLKRYGPTVKPEELEEDIVALLG